MAQLQLLTCIQRLFCLSYILRRYQASKERSMASNSSFILRVQLQRKATLSLTLAVSILPSTLLAIKLNSFQSKKFILFCRDQMVCPFLSNGCIRALIVVIFQLQTVILQSNFDPSVYCWEVFIFTRISLLYKSFIVDQLHNSLPLVHCKSSYSCTICQLSLFIYSWRGTAICLTNSPTRPLQNRTVYYWSTDEGAWMSGYRWERGCSLMREWDLELLVSRSRKGEQSSELGTTRFSKGSQEGKCS